MNAYQDALLKIKRYESDATTTYLDDKTNTYNWGVADGLRLALNILVAAHREFVAQEELAK